MIAGIMQFTAWKARLLECCRAAPPSTSSANAKAAFGHGLKLGLHCIRCCLGFTAILLVLGVMDLRAMAAVTLGIIMERLSPAGRFMARNTGACVIAAGLWMLG